jgi:predicted ester cyclase
MLILFIRYNFGLNERGSAMSTTETRSEAYVVMQRMLDEGFAAGNGAVADELCSPELVEHQFGLAGAPGEAVQHVKDAMRDVHGAVPDLRFTIEDTVEDGDTIWVRARGQGTATGPFFGPPSRRPVDFTVIDVARVVGGQIVEHWGVPDRFAVLAQTGILDRLA